MDNLLNAAAAIGAAATAGLIATGAAAAGRTRLRVAR